MIPSNHWVKIDQVDRSNNNLGVSKNDQGEGYQNP